MARPLRLAILISAALLLLMVSASAPAAQKKSSLKLSGPASVKLGKGFKYVASGYDASPANFIWGWEASGKCSKKAKKEYEKLNKPARPTIGKTLTVNHNFSETTNFTARVAGKHHLCVYLINSQTLKTYARASAQWVDHN